MFRFSAVFHHRSRSIPHDCARVASPIRPDRHPTPDRRDDSLKPGFSAGGASECSHFFAITPASRPGPRVWLFFTRRRRARTLAGGTRAFSSAYHRDYEATEIRTLKGCRNSSHPAGCAWLLGLSSRWLRSLRSLTTGYSPGTPPACENGQTPGAGFSRRHGVWTVVRGYDGSPLLDKALIRRGLEFGHFRTPEACSESSRWLTSAASVTTG